MKEKSTGDLRQELMEQANLHQYITENHPYFSSPNLQEELAALYGRLSISKAELARRAGMSEVYLHQVFSGRRRPSRDRLLCICVGLEATLEESQRLLKQMGYAPIYPKLKRDAIILHGILHHTPLVEINDNLFKENEKTMF